MRRTAALFVLVFGMLCLLCSSAFAEEISGAMAEETQFYVDGERSFVSIADQDTFMASDDAVNRLYEIWHQYLLDLANGKRTSTEFEFSGPAVFGSAYYSTAADMQNMVANTISKARANLINDSLYEFHWYGKGYYWNITPGQDSNGYYCVSFVVRLPVYDLFRETPDNEFEVSHDYARQVQAALSRAQDIVRKNRTLPDIAKMRAYKDSICDLTHHIMSDTGSTTSSYYAPFQIIWAFDDDQDTAIECTAYTRAFKYLMDLSAFNTVRDHVRVHGTISGNPHWWNMVNIGGLYYIVDVTYCDAIGGRLTTTDDYFMTGYTEQDGDNYVLRLHYSTQTYHPETKPTYAWANHPYWEHALPSGTKRISEEAFANTILHRISLGNSVQVIEDRAFADCLVEAIYIPPSCTNISETTFEGDGWNYPVIFGVAGSRAEEFANEHNYAFRTIN